MAYDREADPYIEFEDAAAPPSWRQERMRLAVDALEAERRFPESTVRLDAQCPDLAQHEDVALLVMGGKLRAEILGNASSSTTDIARARSRAYWHQGALVWVRASITPPINPQRPPRWYDGPRGIIGRAGSDVAHDRYDIERRERRGVTGLLNAYAMGAAKYSRVRRAHVVTGLIAELGGTAPVHGQVTLLLDGRAARRVREVADQVWPGSSSLGLSTVELAGALFSDRDPRPVQELVQAGDVVERGEPSTTEVARALDWSLADLSRS